MLRKLGLIAVIFLCALGASSCTPHKEVVSGLTEHEAQRICVLLQRNGLNAKKEKAGSEDEVTWSVTMETPFIVGDEAVAAALNILNENDLPRSKRNPYKEAFSGEGLIPTPTEESLRKLAATQESVELTLEQMPGIVSARVAVVLPNPNPLVPADQQVKASASVLLKYNTETEPLTVDEVRRLVAPAIEGMQANSVEVVMKAVPKPDATKFDNLKNRFIKIIGLSAVTIIMILTGLLVFFIARVKRLTSKIAQLERNLAVRPAAKAQAVQPAAAGR